MFKKSKKIDTFLEHVDGINLLLANQLGEQCAINILLALNLVAPKHPDPGKRWPIGS